MIFNNLDSQFFGDPNLENMPSARRYNESKNYIKCQYTQASSASQRRPIVVSRPFDRPSEAIISSSIACKEKGSHSSKVSKYLEEDYRALLATNTENSQ